MLKNCLRRYGSSTGHHHHGTPINEPGGYLFGHVPGKPRNIYWWEPMYYVGMYGSMIAFIAAEYFSPRDSPTQTAKIIAQKRLSERGEDFGWPLPPDYAIKK